MIEPPAVILISITSLALGFWSALRLWRVHRLGRD